AAEAAIRVHPIPVVPCAGINIPVEFYAQRGQIGFHVNRVRGHAEQRSNPNSQQKFSGLIRLIQTVHLVYSPQEAEPDSIVKNRHHCSFLSVFGPHKALAEIFSSMTKVAVRTV
ncbi:MAG: hypothetical protein ACO3KY_04725, partial [Lysobacterales bacterium]